MNQIPFPTVLASTVHDMKNSLGLLLQSLDSILAQVPEAKRNSLRELGILQYEAARVNSDLVQVLALYKLEQNQLPLNLNYHELGDFLDIAVAEHRDLLDLRGIKVECEADYDLGWAFDQDLVGSVLNNIITNTIRYSKSLIRVSAFVEADFLVIEVADDGPGYPAAMITAADRYMAGINHSTGSTGLGLYFAGMAARLHKRADLEGRIELHNARRMAGGEFRLYLP